VKRILSLMAVAVLLLAPSTSDAQLSIFGGQQTWTYTGGGSYTGMGGGLGLRTGILPIFDLAVDASYYVFPDENGVKVSSLNYTASAILGSKKERVNIYAGVGQYDLRFDGTAQPVSLGAHAGISLRLFGPFSADARLVLLEGEDGQVTEKASTRIVPVTLRWQF
jgi:hypothetical protein